MSKAKLPFEITNKSGKAVIAIVGEISWWKNSSTEFIRRVDELLGQGYSDVELYINTPGGDMFHANEIGNQIARFSGEKSCLLGALVASAGTLISTYCDSDKIEASSNTQYMMHDPATRPVIKRLADWESSKKLYENLRNDAIDQYVKLTGIDSEEISTMLEKVTWMNAKELLKKKFVAKIRSEKATLPEDAKAVLNSYQIELPEVLNQAFEETTENLNNEEPNMKEIAKLLGLPENATEDQLQNAIKLIQAQAKFGTDALMASAKAKGLDEGAVKNLAAVNLESAVTLVTSAKAPKVESKKDDDDKDDDDKDVNKTPDNNRVTDVLAELAKLGAGGAATPTNKGWADMSAEEKTALEDKDPEAYEKLFKESHKNIDNPQS